MPDMNALMPKAPDPSTGLLTGNPLQVLGAIGQLNQAKLFNQVFEARKNIGDAYRGNTNEDGTINRPGLMRDIGRGGGFMAGEGVSQALGNEGTGISNVTAQRNQDIENNRIVADRIGTLAVKPNVTADDIHGLALDLARANPEIPSKTIQSMTGLVLNDPQGIKAGLTKLQNIALGAPGVSTRVTGTPTAEGAQTSIPTGRANYAGTVQTGLAPGQGEAQTAEAQEGQKAATMLQNTAATVPQMHTNLDLMMSDLKQAKDKFGPTAPYEKTANIIASRVAGFMPTMTKEQVGALESFDKVGKQIAMQQAGALHATDQTLSTALGANPNVNLSGYGNEGIINMLHGNADYISTVSKEWNKARQQGVGPNKYYSWLDKFNQSNDPRVFQFMRMDKEQQKVLLENIPDKTEFEKNLWMAGGKGLSAKELAKTGQKGWIKLPGEK